MLITTSKRPGHRTRVLGRELANSILKSRYVPRGTKTVERLVEVARGFGHSRVMFIGGQRGQPKELRFLKVGKKWAWERERIVLKGVDLRRETGKREKIEASEVWPEEEGVEEFARTLGSLMGLSLAKKRRKRAAVLVEVGVEKKNQFSIEFWNGKKEIGPRMRVEKVGKVRSP